MDIRKAVLFLCVAVFMAGCAHQVPYRGDVVRVRRASGFENGIVVLALTGAVPEILQGKTGMVAVNGLVELPAGSDWITVAFEGAYDASENNLVVLGPDILSAFARKMRHTAMMPPYQCLDVEWIAHEGSAWRVTGLAKM